MKTLLLYWTVTAIFGICVKCSQVSDLIGKIQKAYVETLEELSWMDTPSKEKAREKVQLVVTLRS